MSLLTQWQEKQLKIRNAKVLSDLILQGGPFYENQNQWKCYYFNFTYSGSPPLSAISGKTPTKTMLLADTNKSQYWAWGDNYVGLRQCYVYAKNAFTLSTQFWTDDAGRICLNGNSVATSVSCNTTNCTLNFIKGWNLVQILFQEGSGGDGGYLSANLSTNSNIEIMYANKINE